mmetsp:Transcript_12723/g.35164  ORF Transcript_12723/g.35164 Transcript_12723/m.35164 type:complete len:290 (-) Transcript_12723:26-895(-)
MRGKQDKMARTLPAKSLQLPPALSKLWEQTSDAIGIRHLEMLKRNVEEKEENQRLAVERRREALATHDRLVSEQAVAQRELASLLQRREHWQLDEISRFTALTRREHEMKLWLESSLAGRREAEAAADTSQHLFMRSMQERYHAELLWQDKYRALNLYGTWALIGVNMLIFAGGQVLFLRREHFRTQLVTKVVGECSLAAAAAQDAADSCVALAASSNNTSEKVVEKGVEAAEAAVEGSKTEEMALDLRKSVLHNASMLLFHVQASLRDPVATCLVGFMLGAATVHIVR